MVIKMACVHVYMLYLLWYVVYRDSVTFVLCSRVCRAEMDLLLSGKWQ